MPRDSRERDLLKLLVPIETKKKIKQLALAKHTTMNNIGNQLIDRSLNHKTDLLELVADSLSQFRPVEEIVANYHRVVSSYTLLSLIPISQSHNFLEQGTRFRESAKTFVHNLKRQHGVSEH